MLSKFKISIKHLYLFHIALLLFGYQFFTSITSFSDGIITEISRWGYRGLVSILSVIFLYLNFKKIFYYDYNSKIGIIAFFIFWILITFRVSYDILFQSFPTNLIPDLLLSIFGFTVLYLLSLWRNIDYFDVTDFAKISFWFLIIAAFLTPIAQIFNFNQIIEGAERASTERLNPITYGRSCIFLLFISLYLRQINYLGKIQFFVVAIISLIGLFISGSRGGLVVMAIMPFIIFFQQIKYISMNRLFEIFIILTFTVVFLVIITSLFFSNYDFIQSILVAGTNQDDSSSIRLLMYEGAWAQFSYAPFFGDFTLERVTMEYPHNIFLETLMAFGIFGFFFLLIIFIAIILKFKHLVKQSTSQNNEVYLMINLLLISFIGFQFSGSIFFATELWVLIAIFFSIRAKSI